MKLRLRLGGPVAGVVCAGLLVGLGFDVGGSSATRADHYDRYWTAQGTFRCDNRGDTEPIVGARVEFYQAANSTVDSVYTGFRNELGQLGVDVPGHDPLDHLIASTHTDQSGSWSFNLHAVGDTGDPPFYARLVLDDDQGVRLFDGWAKFFDSWSVETSRAGNNGKVVDYGTIDIARDGGSGTPRCAVWQGAHDAYQAYVAETGKRPPSPDHWISYGWPVPTPFTTIGQTNWPDGFQTTYDAVDKATGKFAAGTEYTIVSHEFGHDIRHSLDGDLDEFAKDALRYEYPQQHQLCQLPAGIDDIGRRGFAFNEGWAEFWARQGLPAGCPPNDFRYEGNVDAALTALTVGSPGCPAASRATLVSVLAAHPGAIHSWDEFLADFRQQHRCDLVQVQALGLRSLGSGESGGASARLLVAQQRAEVARLDAALGRVGRRLRTNLPAANLRGCPPNCAVALGNAAAPAVLTAIRSELELVRNEIEAQSGGLSGDALWRRLTTLAGMEQADAQARSFASATSKLTLGGIEQVLATSNRVSAVPGSRLTKQIADFRLALRTIRAPRRAGYGTWVESADADLHRRIGPAQLLAPKPSTLTLTCPASAGSATSVHVNGTLAGGAGASIAITAPGAPNGGTQTVSADASGAFSYAYYTPAEIQQVTITASFAGTRALEPSDATCTIEIVGIPTELSLTVPGSPLVVGATASVGVQMTSPEPGDPIEITYTAPDGTKTTHSVTTDDSGKATDTITASRAGTWTVTAHYAGSKTRPAADAPPQTFSTLGAAKITLTCPSPGTVVLGSASSLSGTLTPATNGTPVRITYTPPSGSPAKAAGDDVTTDATGYFADSYGWPAAGTWTITAHYAGNATTGATTSNPCTVTVLGH